MIPKTDDMFGSTPATKVFSPEEIDMLRKLLWDKDWSRNQQFEQVEQPMLRRLHRITKHLRSLHREMLRKDGHVWVETLSTGGVCLHIHRPNVGLSRRVLLSDTEWLLLQELAQTT